MQEVHFSLLLVITLLLIMANTSDASSAIFQSKEVKDDNITISVKPSPYIQEIFNPRRVPAGQWEDGPLHQWTGSDVDVSTPITEKHLLFVYGDTLVGYWNNTKATASSKDEHNNGDDGGVSHQQDIIRSKILGVDGNRICHPTQPVCNGLEVSAMPHSSVGIYNRESGSIFWVWGANQTSFLQPSWANAKTIFWATAVTPLRNDTVCAVGIRVQFTESGGPFGFILNGTFVVCLHGVNSRPTDPRSWRQSWSEIPFTGNSSSSSLFSQQHHFQKRENDQSSEKKQQDEVKGAIDLEWNNAIFLMPSDDDEADDMLYLFGSLKPTDTSSGRQVVTRIAYTSFLNFEWGELEMWGSSTRSTAPQWIKNFFPTHSPFDLAAIWQGESIPEFTIQFSPLLKRLYMIYNDNFGYAVKIRMSSRTNSTSASSTSGPSEEMITGQWTEKTTPIYSYPPPFNDAKKVFCYAVKVHDGLNALALQPLVVESDDNDENQKHENGVEANNKSPPYSSTEKKKKSEKGKGWRKEGGNTQPKGEEFHVFSYVCNAFQVENLYEVEFRNVYLPVFNVVKFSC